MNPNSETPSAALDPPQLSYSEVPPKTPKPGWLGRLAVFFGSIFLFLLACMFPALIFQRNGGDLEEWPGIWVILSGWMGLFFGQVAWYANLVMVLSLIFVLFHRWLTASVIAGVALALAADSLLLFSKEIPADEGGVNKLRLAQLGPGFYFWVAGMMVVVVGALILRRHYRATASQSAG